MRDIVRSMRRAAAFLLLTGGLLAGCSSEAAKPPLLPRVAASETVPPTATPTAAPEAATTAVPPPARAQSPEGASAFARFYFAQVERAFASGDPMPIERLSLPGCSGCQAYITSVREISDAKETPVGVSFAITSAEAPGFDGEEARVDVIYDTAGSKLLDAAGLVVFEEPASRDNQMQMALVREADSWVVSALVRLS